MRDSCAFRWYLGIDLDEQVPDHSTISQLRQRKPKFRKVFRRLFEKVVGQCVEKGLVSGRLAVTDSTHVKANASRASEEQVEDVHQKVIPLQAAAADSAYDFPLALRVLEVHGIEFFVGPQPTHDRTQVEFKRDAFTYDAAKDVYIYPNGNALRPKGLYRNGRFGVEAPLPYRKDAII